jgi:hypothetical protein
VKDQSPVAPRRGFTLQRAGGIITSNVGTERLYRTEGIVILIWRYRKAQQMLNVLRMGEPVLGTIVDIHENLAVEVNGRNPWTITYGFQVDGQVGEGKTATLRPVGFTHQLGQPVYVLYLPDDPTQNTIYLPVM